MNCLLDTHVFLWSAMEPAKLSMKARKAIIDPENTVCVSAVSFWEISLTTAIGKLELEGVTPDELPDVAERMGFMLLPLLPRDACSFHCLPRSDHRDPFDRMLVWQAIAGGLTLVSKDRRLNDYTAEGLRLLR